MKKNQKKKLGYFKCIMAMCTILVCMNAVELNSFADNGEKSEQTIFTEKDSWLVEKEPYVGVADDTVGKESQNGIEEHSAGEKITTREIEELCSSGAIEVIYDGRKISVIMGKFTDKKIETVEDAAELLNMAAPLFGEHFHADPSDIVLKSAGGGEDRENYYRYNPTVEGMSVSGGDIILSCYGNGEVNGLFNYYVDAIHTMDRVPTITEEAAEAAVRESILAKAEVQEFLDLTYEMMKLKWEIGVTREDIVEAYQEEISMSSYLLILAEDDRKGETPKLVYAVSAASDLTLRDERGKAVYAGGFDRTYYVCANENAGEIYMSAGNNPTISAGELEDLSAYVRTRKIENGIMLVIVLALVGVVLYEKRISQKRGL